MKILHEDNCILVLDKEVGIVVNNSQTSSSNTVQDFLREKLSNELSSANTESEFYLRAGVLHRLDKDTSGVLLVAKNEESFENLKQQFLNREVTKEYLVVALGKIEDTQIEVNAPIARDPRKRMQMAVVKEGREALTVFEKIKELEIDDKIYTYLNAFPKTGRTHQIRVHLTALGHPVALDPIYCTRREYESMMASFTRMMLHAHKLSFVNPCTNNKEEYVSDIPAEFLGL